jgi:hypothetical protein
MTWAAFDNERTGYIKPEDYMSFWRVRQYASCNHYNREILTIYK